MITQPKLMLLSPLVLTFILAWIFRAVGGGGGVRDEANMAKVVSMKLPDAKPDVKGKVPDKMDIYAKAAIDSAKYVEALKQDPYAAARVAGAAISGLDSLRIMARTGDKRLQTDLSARQLQMETTASEVMQRLNQLKALTQAQGGPAQAGQQPSGWAGQSMESYPRTMFSSQPFRTQPVMGREVTQPMSSARQDGELGRLEGMLDKIYRVQHPDLASRDTGGEHIEVAVLERSRKEESVHVLSGEGGTGETITNAFIEIGEKDTNDLHRFAGDAIPAVVANEQTLTAGTTVALRLTQEAVVRGILIPVGQEVNGVATLSGERLHIAIGSLRVGQTLVNVSLQVYDLDGLQGIRVPRALSRDVSKQSADEALGGLGIASVDQNLSAQAASAGLQFAKSLASRKVRLVRVTLPADYQVLLKNTKSNNY